MVAAGDAARRWSLTLSGTLIVIGVVVAGAVLTGKAALVADAPLLGLPPVVAGLVTAVLAWRR